MKKVFKVREVIRIIEGLGWYLDRQSIEKQAGIRFKDFVD